MTTRQIFQLDDSKVQFLREFLAHPVIVEAISIVKQECVPSQPMPIPGVDMCHMMAIEGAKSVGANKFVQQLTSLTTKAIPRDPMTENTDHETAIQSLLKSGVYKDRTEVEKLIKEQT